MNDYRIFGWLGSVCLLTVLLVGTYTKLGLAHEMPTTAPTAGDTVLAPAAFSWQDEVYQSFRNGNWEIMYTPFAKASIQLTNHPAADTLPRLNVGSTKILFVSNRDGNEEIYKMNIDGSGLTRLTVDGATDTYPYWSPDGTQLVFTSQRTGNGDIYLMQQNGAGLRRITADEAEDTHPTWSPDGNQLLWVRLYPVLEKDQPQEGELWVANSDGSGAHPLTGRIYFPSRPLISPDGARIAFNADFNKNGLLDLVIMDRNGGNAFTYLPGDVGRLYLMGTWYPDSSGISVTKLSYFVPLIGPWTLEYSDIEQHCFNDPYCGSLIPDDRKAMHPDRQYADLLVPTSTVDTLPVYARLGGFWVSWAGKEFGPSGLVGFDVQYRHETESEWQYLWRGTLNSDLMPEVPILEQGGQTFVPSKVGNYYFRSRALDYAGNYEAWPASTQGDTSTTVFSWYLNGAISDGRGVPIARQAVTLQPSALESPVTDAQGAFQVRIGEPGTYTLADEFAMQMNQDQTKVFYRVPTDNVLINGGFEEALSNGWHLQGTHTLTTSTALVHSGKQTLQMGNGCAAPCLTAVGPSDISNLTQQFLTMAPDGVLHLFGVKPPSTLTHQMRTPDGRWLPYTALANDIGTLSPAALFDAKGDLHLIWSAFPASSGAEDRLYYARYRSGQGWTQPEALGLGIRPKAAFDAQQQLHLLYQCSDATECQLGRLGYRKRSTNGTWSAPKLLATNDRLIDYAIATIDNSVHISWVELDNPRSIDRLLVATLAANGDFSSYRQLESGTPPNAGYSRYEVLHMVVDRQKRLHLGWSGMNEATLYYTNRDTNGSWQPISALQPTAEANTIRLHSMLLDHEDTVHFILLRAQQFPTFDWQRTTGGLWLPPEAFQLFDTTNYYLTAVTLGLENEQYFALESYDPVTQIKRTTVVTEATTTLLQQTLTVPATLHKPTLSFLYQLQGSGNHGSAFTATVSTAISTTTLYTDSVAGAWQLGWADLSPWQGDTITVTFTVHQAVGDRHLQVALDRVALGSWRTPLPQTLSPDQVPWGIGTTVTISGTNFLATPQVEVDGKQLTDVQMLDEETLTATLPTNLTPGRYEVWVINPSGERSRLPRQLRVGEELYLPVVYQ